MRIVLVSSVTLTGDTKARATGIGIYVKELSKALVGLKIPVTLVTGTAGSGDAGAGQNSDLLKVISVSERSASSNIGFILKLMFKMKRLGLDSDCIVHAQRPELLLPFTLLKRNIPRICTLHGSAYKSVSGKHSGAYTWFYRKLEGFCLKRAAVIISVDKYTRNEYKERYAYLSDTVHIIPTGLDLDRFKLMDKKKLRKKYDLPPAAPVIIFAGRLEREKRVDLLIKAFGVLCKNKIYNNNRPYLLIAGDGSRRHELEKLAVGLKLANIKFMGAVPHDDMPELLNCGDVFALVSEFEGSPTVVKEALACGLPVVATRVGNVPELIKPGETGDTVPVSADADEIAGKLSAVLEAASSGEITREGCAKKVRPFAWQKIAKKLVGIYNETR